MTWTQLGRDQDDVTRFRMAVAEVGGNLAGVTYPDEEYRQRGAALLVDYALNPAHTLWMASEVASLQADADGNWMCWACAPHRPVAPEIWNDARDACLATRRCMRDCGKDRS
jgi:hypothetical protein